MENKPSNVFEIASAAGKKPSRAAMALPDEVRQGLKMIYEHIQHDHVMDNIAFEAHGFTLEKRIRLSDYLYDLHSPVLMSDLHTMMQDIRPYYRKSGNMCLIDLIDGVMNDLTRIIQNKPKADVRTFVRPNKKTETGVDPR